MFAEMLSLMVMIADPTPASSSPPSASATNDSAPNMPTPAFVEPPKDATAYAAATKQMMRAPFSELFAFARYGDQKPREDLGQSARLGGGAVRMASLYVGRSSVADVTLYYQHTLAEKGILPHHGMLEERVGGMSFRDPADGFIRTLTFLQQGAGTVVIAAVGDPDKILEPTAADARPPSKGWPMPSTTGAPTDMEFVDGNAIQRTRRASVSVSDPREVMKFYLKELPPLGWKAEPGSVQNTGKAQIGTFVRGAERCSLSVVSATNGTSTLEVNCFDRRTP
jgi:hypothetical protein